MYRPGIEGIPRGLQETLVEGTDADFLTSVDDIISIEDKNLPEFWDLAGDIDKVDGLPDFWIITSTIPDDLRIFIVFESALTDEALASFIDTVPEEYFENGYISEKPLYSYTDEAGNTYEVY